MDDQVYGLTDPGNLRDKNEDTFIALRTSGNALLIGCVIDGVGGYNGGEVAAEIARSVLIQHLENLEGNIVQELREAIIAANGKICEKKMEDTKNSQMACVLTCAIADIKNNKFYYAHVGDTRLYLLRDQSLVKISTDHSTVGFLEESGRLTEEEAMRHPMRNEINKALGLDANIESIADYIETGESPFLPGDTLLLCSDGLSDMLPANAIAALMNNEKKLSAIARSLVKAANNAGGKDNITAVLVQNNKIPGEYKTIKPIEKKQGNENSAAIIKLPASNGNVPSKEKKRGLKTPVFILVFLGVLAAIGLSIFKHKDSNKADQREIVANLRNAGAAELISHVSDSSKQYIIEPGHAAISINSPILIAKDTFQLYGKGVTISADTSVKTPAFIIGENAKYILLDSIVFKDFDVALLAQKNNLLLRDVRFINCRVPVDYQLTLRDTTLSGRLRDTIFFKSTNK